MTTTPSATQPAPQIELPEAQRTKTARDIMTRDVRTVPADATLQEVAMLLVTHGISGAPVVDAAGKMIGIISESDLLSDAKRRAALPHMAAFGIFLVPEETLQRIYHNGATLLAEQVMIRHVTTVGPDASLQSLTDLMLKQKINRLPVLEEGRLIGIITREDILRGLFGV